MAVSSPQGKKHINWWTDLETTLAQHSSASITSLSSSPSLSPPSSYLAVWSVNSYSSCTTVTCGERPEGRNNASFCRTMAEAFDLRGLCAACVQTRPAKWKRGLQVTSLYVAVSSFYMPVAAFTVTQIYTAADATAHSYLQCSFLTIPASLSLSHTSLAHTQSHPSPSEVTRHNEALVPPSAALICQLCNSGESDT